jgi:ubiquinol-cytochrome c reductase cytochrome b subunit
MNAIPRWLNDRTGLTDFLQRRASEPLAGGPSWARCLPAAIVFAFCIQAITGFFIWAYYSPAVQSAWESVYWLQCHVACGWLLRAMHHYAGQLLLALAALNLLQIIVRGWYRAPGEMVYWAALLLCLCAIALLLTGDLLPWSQNGYAATQVRTKFLLLLPGVGESLYKIAIGGPAMGQLTLTRFLALHVGLFSAGFLLLLVLNHIFIRRANAGVAAQASHVEPYCPGQAWRNAAAGVMILAIVLILALQHGYSGDRAGVALGSPADTDPADFYSAARPEWALRGIYEFSQLFPGEEAILPIFIVPGLILIYLVLLPLIGRIRVGHYFNVAASLVLLGGLVFLTYRSYAKDAADAKQEQAVAEERTEADRAIELARAKGIPPTGALALLQGDAKTQGPKLFRQQCASCHNWTDRNGEGIKAEPPSAPNLHGFATREWIAGLLDPKTITGSNYYGGTKLRAGGMASFVRENLGSKLDEDERKNLEKVVAAVSAEAQLKAQRAIDQRDAAMIVEGRKLLVDDFSCTDCHKFRDNGKLGDAPDLTGYGSAEWTAVMIANPKSKRFFGSKNDRMPAYAETADPARNILSPETIRLLSDWLRGDWFRSDEKQP